MPNDLLREAVALRSECWDDNRSLSARAGGVIDTLLDRLAAVELERDALKSHAEAMASGVEAFLGLEDYRYELICDPVSGYRKTHPLP